jgi:holo-[acyl-carrier protein] synthase
MIIGIGIDLVDSRRIAKLMEKHEPRFLEKYYTAKEIEYFNSIQNTENRILSIAKRFAAKEACAKALGTGFRDNIAMNSMEIEKDSLGKPLLRLHGGALAYLEKKLSQGKNYQIHLSLTDEPPYAQAQVIIETL